MELEMEDECMLPDPEHGWLWWDLCWVVEEVWLGSGQ